MPESLPIHRVGQVFRFGPDEITEWPAARQSTD